VQLEVPEGGWAGWFPESCIATQIQGSLTGSHAGKLKAASEIEVLPLPPSLFPVSQLLQDRQAFGQSKSDLGVFFVAEAVKGPGNALC